MYGAASSPTSSAYRGDSARVFESTIENQTFFQE
jgi:hypothetical protein